MANNKLVKVNQKEETLSPFNRLGDIEHTLDKLWNMFQTQVNRNAELMLIIQQQQEAQKVNLSPVTTESTPATKQLTDITTSSMPELGFEKLKRIESLLNKIGISVRIDAMHSLINVLHYLHQFGGESYPEQLVCLSGVSSASFYRYLTRIRECHIVKMVRGKVVMTELGRKIFNEELTGVIELMKAQDKVRLGHEREPHFYNKIVKVKLQTGLPVD